MLQDPKVTEAQKSTAQGAELRETDHHDTCPLPTTPRHCLERSRILPPTLPHLYSSLFLPSSFSSHSLLFPSFLSLCCLPPPPSISSSPSPPSPEQEVGQTMLVADAVVWFEVCSLPAKKDSSDRGGGSPIPATHRGGGVCTL